MDQETLREYMFKEVDVLQGIINRMGFNSFMIKGWTVTLVAVTLLLKASDKQHAMLAFIPLLVFWGLDAYFLWLERKFRDLYKWVIENRPKGNAEKLLDVNPNDRERIRPQTFNFWAAFFSFTLIAFYLLLFALTLIYVFCF